MRLRYIKFIFIFLLILLTCSYTANAFPKELSKITLDFENGSFDGWAKTRFVAPYSGMIVTDTVRKGKYAARFEARTGDRPTRHGYRSEILEKYCPNIGDNVWYGFNIYIPPSFPRNNNRSVIAQWYTPPDNKVEKKNEA
jgi:hypothetical protein